MPNAVDPAIHLNNPVNAIISGGYELEAISMLIQSYKRKYDALAKERAEYVVALQALQRAHRGDSA